MSEIEPYESYIISINYQVAAGLLKDTLGGAKKTFNFRFKIEEIILSCYIPPVNNDGFVISNVIINDIPLVSEALYVTGGKFVQPVPFDLKGFLTFTPLALNVGGLPYAYTPLFKYTIDKEILKEDWTLSLEVTNIGTSNASVLLDVRGKKYLPKI